MQLFGPLRFRLTDPPHGFRGLEWNGLDTLVVCAGVSALRPLLELAGLESKDGKVSPPQASTEGVQHTVDVAHAAIRGNYIGPLVCAVTFVSSLAPSRKTI